MGTPSAFTSLILINNVLDEAALRAAMQSDNFAATIVAFAPAPDILIRSSAQALTLAIPVPPGKAFAH
jgi:hypothetical protein